MPTYYVTMNMNILINIFPCLQDILKGFLYHQVYSSYKFTYGFSISKPITILIIYDKNPDLQQAEKSEKQLTTLNLRQYVYPQQQPAKWL